MEIGPYLTFDGTCEAALNFYAEVFGGVVENLMTVAQSPMADDFPADMQGLIMHGRVSFVGGYLMGSDAIGAPYERAQGITVQISFDDLDRAKRVFDRLAKHGVITMAFEKTFWAGGFGMCRDRFGIPWMVDCDVTA